MNRAAGSKDPASYRSSEPRGFTPRQARGDLSLSKVSPGGICLLAVALSISVGAQQAPPAPASGTGLIAGRVVDVTSGLPVAGVEVNLNRAVAPRPGPGGSASYTGSVPVLTDSQGRFAFASLLEGRYRLVSPPRNQYVPVRGASVTLAADQRVTDVTLRVGRYGSIAGWVRDDAGDPIVGIGVRIFQRRFTGFAPMLSPRGSALTDDRGQFRVGGLPAGEYLVCACGKDPLPIDKDMLTRLAPVAVPLESVGKQLDASVPTFAPTFHPGSTRVAGALPVTVRHGADVTGISVTMLAVTPARVTGRITGGGATPGTTYKVLIVPEDEDPAAFGISELIPVSVTAEGAFVFAGVTPGRYTLEGFPASGKPGLSASMAVSVDERDVTDLVLSLSEGVTVRGRLEFGGGSPRPGPEVLRRGSVGLIPMEFTVGMMIGIGASGSGTVSSAVVSADGTFSISGVRPGRYRLHAGAMGTTWTTVDSVRWPDGMNADGALTVTPAGIDGVVITMSDTPQATLHGTFTLGKYESPNDSSVMVFPVDYSRWDDRSTSDRFVLISAHDVPEFRLEGIRPGDYYVVLVDADDRNTAPGRLEEFAKRATTVTLRGGQTTTVQLKR